MNTEFNQYGFVVVPKRKMNSKNNLNKLLNNYGYNTTIAGRRAAWKKAILELHPNKGGNTALFQKASALFNDTYKNKTNAQPVGSVNNSKSPLRRSPVKIFNFWATMVSPFSLSMNEFRRLFGELEVGREIYSHKIISVTVRGGGQAIGAVKNNKGVMGQNKLNQFIYNNMTIKFLNTEDNKSSPAVTINVRDVQQLKKKLDQRTILNFQGGGDLNKLFSCVKKLIADALPTKAEMRREDLDISQESGQFFINKKIDSQRVFEVRRPGVQTIRYKALEYLAKVIRESTDYTVSSPINTSVGEKQEKKFSKASRFSQPVDLPKQTPGPARQKIRVGPQFVTIRTPEFTIKLGTNHVVQFMGKNVDPARVFYVLKQIYDIVPAGVFIDESNWKPKVKVNVPRVKEAVTTCKNPPTPATFDGTCPPGYYCRPNNDGYPCCYMIPMSNPMSARSTCIESYRKWKVPIPAKVRALPFMTGVNAGPSNAGPSNAGRGVNRVTVTNKKVLVGSKDCTRHSVAELKEMARRAGIPMPSKMPQEKKLKNGRVIPGGWKYYICRELALKELSRNKSVAPKGPHARVNIKGNMTNLYIINGDPIKISGFKRHNKRRAEPEITSRVCKTLDRDILVQIAEAMGIETAGKSKPVLCTEMHAKSRSSGVANNNFNKLLNNAFAAMSNNSNSNEEPPPPPPKATKMNKINNMILERALLGNEAARTAVRRMGGARAEKLQASILNKLKENASQPTFRRGLAKVNVEVM
jgi:hypothetical protein